MLAENGLAALVLVLKAERTKYLQVKNLKHKTQEIVLTTGNKWTIRKQQQKEEEDDFENLPKLN